jgi:hypothetical protein
MPNEPGFCLILHMQNGLCTQSIALYARLRSARRGAACQAARQRVDKGISWGTKNPVGEGVVANDKGVCAPP